MAPRLPRAFRRRRIRRSRRPKSIEMSCKRKTPHRLTMRRCLHQRALFERIGTPTGSRTPVFGLRIRRPGPLDDGGVGSGRQRELIGCQGTANKAWCRDRAGLSTGRSGPHAIARHKPCCRFELEQPILACRRLRAARRSEPVGLLHEPLHLDPQAVEEAGLELGPVAVRLGRAVQPSQGDVGPGEA